MHRRFEAQRFLGDSPEAVRCVRRFDTTPTGWVTSTDWVAGRKVAQQRLTPAQAEAAIAELGSWIET